MEIHQSRNSNSVMWNFQWSNFIIEIIKVFQKKTIKFNLFLFSRVHVLFVALLHVPLFHSNDEIVASIFAEVLVWIIGLSRHSNALEMENESIFEHDSPIHDFQRHSPCIDRDDLSLRRLILALRFPDFCLGRHSSILISSTSDDLYCLHQWTLCCFSASRQ